MTVRATTAVALALSLSASALPAHALEGDPERGEQAYVLCAACHVADAEEHGVGPHLVGVFGREAGTAPDFDYSEALIESDIVWDEETIDAYIADPEGYIPGNEMIMAPVDDPQERADIIAYLREVTE